MTLDSIKNCKLTTFKKGDEVRIYDFIADEGYCFRNNAEPVVDDEGNTYFNHPTAFSLLACELDKLADYDCITLEEAEQEKVPEGIFESVPEVVDEDKATETDYINALEELGVNFNE